VRPFSTPESVLSTVAEGKVVSFHYTLTAPDGAVLDTSDGGEPLMYLHGADNIVTGLEKQLQGKSVGDRFEAVVPPSEGYGEKEGPGPQAVPRAAFPPEAEIAVGVQFVAEGEGGQEIGLFVTSIAEDEVFVDTNHPLAGVELRFSVEVAGVRDASEEEVAHGHPHGPHGHHDHE